MKNQLPLTILLLLALAFMACQTSRDLNTWTTTAPFFEVQELFADERFPNIVVTKKGTVLATWGRQHFRARRSEDGGQTWGPEITIADPGFQGGGTTIDESNGDILAFAEDYHPVAPIHLYRSTDDGLTWKKEPLVQLPNSLGHSASMHMNEHGITLTHKPYTGRLIRPSRYYGGGNDREFWDDHYTNAIFSDDNGKTWQVSEPFPAFGTGEAALVELSTGRLYYNSRRHQSTDGLNPRRRYTAWSDDGGLTWIGMKLCEALPDGDQNRDYGLMAGLVRLPMKDRDVLLFSNIESPEGRHHGTVWASFDGGVSWPVKRLIDEGSFAYSSLAVGRKGTPSEGLIYLLYESGHGAKVARFNLAWLLNDKPTAQFLQ